jgi:outer membrane receptor protein involved in Fe transport
MPHENTKNSFLSRARGPVALATLCALGLLAQAQAEEEGEVRSATELPTITVTSTKRTERIQDLPESVSAIDADQLSEHHVAGYADITRIVPGIAFGAGAGPGLDTLEMRGVSSTSGSATVGIYLDEVSITVKNTYDGQVQPKLVDLERVEVLRGPQGTLYGASSLGGTLRFITKEPNLKEVTGSAGTDLSVTAHGGFNNEEFAALSLPLVKDTLAIRISADFERQSGYIDRLQPTPTGAGPGGTVLSLATNDTTGAVAQKGVNDVITNALRVQAKYAGSDGLTIQPALFVQKVSQADGAIFYPSLGTYNQDKRVAEPGKDLLTVPSVTVRKPLGDVELTSVTSYFRRDFRRITDGTYYNSGIFANTVILPNVTSTPAQAYATQTQIGFLPGPVYYDTTNSQFSQELRLDSRHASLASIPVEWIAGVYFANLRQDHSEDDFMPGLQAAFQQIYGTPIDASAVGGATYPGVSYANDNVYHSYLASSERQVAPFGQLDLHLAPDLKASLGMRYVRARTSFTASSYGYYAFGLPSPISADASYSASSPRFALDYTIDPNRNVYANVAKGFRLGGPTGPVPAYVPNGPCNPDYQSLGMTSAPIQYDSDSLWNYEVGSKGRYLGNRLQVNAALYAIRWKNVQQTVNLPTCGYNFTANVGDANTYGSELEVRAVVTPHLTVGVNAGSTHAFITRTSNPDNAPVGQTLLNVPGLTATFVADYDAPVTDDINGFARVDFPWIGHSHGYYDVPLNAGIAVHQAPAYGLLNLNVGLQRKSMQVGLYAKNALNSHRIIQYPSVNTVQEGYTVQPRTIGVTVNWQPQ